MSGESQHILCIDDDDDTLDLTKMSLELTGDFRVTCRSSAADIVSLVAREKPGLVLLDVMMPDVDGLTALKMLQESMAREGAGVSPVPVIFVTAHAKPQQVREYLDRGAAGVIAKPFDPRKISAVVADIWHHASKEQS